MENNETLNSEFNNTDRNNQEPVTLMIQFKNMQLRQNHIAYTIPEPEFVHHDIYVEGLQKFKQFIARQCDIDIKDALILKLD